ncbi:MAG: hypothetical protein JWQ23_635, partial [Herminiimonas sp.]|nr:hypothetical protein [Herminiimonas sp.]
MDTIKSESALLKQESLKMYIDGKWVASSNGRTLESV